MYKTHEFENGLKVLSYHMPKMESVSMGIWIACGGRYENAKLSGISHFLEHVVFKGTKKRTGRELKQAIEGIGGSFNGFTAEEFTCYLVKVLNRHLPLALDVLSDMTLNPLLRSEDIEKERGVILEEIGMYRDIPMHYVHELLDGLLWPGQPLGLPLAGTAESVSSINKDMIYDYKMEHHNPSNMVVVVTGAYKEESLLPVITKFFKKLLRGKRSAFEPASVSQNKAQTKYMFKKTEQMHIAMGVHSVKRDHPDRYVLSLLNIILGGNMSSRLFHELRERRGLAYEIGTQVKRYKDSGAFVVHAGIDNKKLIQAVELILKELSSMKKTLVKDDEFKRAKEYYRGQLLLALEDTMDYMLWLGEGFILNDRLRTPQEILAQVDKVTPDDLRRVANRVFNTNDLNFALIGPIQDATRKRLERALEL